MSDRLRRRPFRHPPAHANEPTRALSAAALLVLALGLAGCAGPAPHGTPSPTASSSPSGTMSPVAIGRYDDLGQACTGITDDLITLHTIQGTVQVGLDRDGADAVLDDLREMRRLAPPALQDAYRSVEDAIERLPLPEEPSPTPTATRPAPSAASPSPTPSTARPTPTPSPPPIEEIIDDAAATLTAWLTENCASR